MKTSAKRTPLRSGRDVRPDDDRRAVGELREAAGRDLLAVRDALGDLDPAVGEIDAERDLALAGDVLLDEKELRHARERGEGAPRDGERALVPADDHLAVPEEAGPDAVVQIRDTRLEGDRA